MKNTFKNIYLKQVVKISGSVNGKHNIIQDQLITDIVERVRHNIATIQANGLIELYYQGSLVKQLVVLESMVTLEDIENGKQVTIAVTDDTTDEYTIDELRLISARSGYDGSGGSATYSIYTLATTVTKTSSDILHITWQLQFVRGGS